MDSRSQQTIHTYCREVQSAAWFSEAKFRRREVIYASSGFQHQIDEIGEVKKLEWAERGKFMPDCLGCLLGKQKRAMRENSWGFKGTGVWEKGESVSWGGGL